MARHRVSPVELATRIVAAAAGLTTIVYVAGSLVLVLRLAFVGLPGFAVIGQLPRDLALSNGVGFVLMPALALIGAYAGYRFTVAGNMPPSGVRRWRDGAAGHNRGRIVVRVLLSAVGLIIIPIIAYRWSVHYRHGEGQTIPPAWLVLVVAAATFAVLSAAVFGQRELRAVLARREATTWTSPGSVAAMAAAYAIVALPLCVAVGAVVPLRSAHVCTTVGFAEDGDLVGEGNEAVYLGERRSRGRRIAIIPTSRVEEVFVGHHADDAECDPRGAASAIEATAVAGRAIQDAEAARAIADRGDTGDDRRLARIVRDVAHGAQDVGDLANRRMSAVGGSTTDAGHNAFDAAQRLSPVPIPPWLRPSGYSFSTSQGRARAGLLTVRGKMRTAADKADIAAERAHWAADQLVVLQQRDALEQRDAAAGVD